MHATPCASPSCYCPLKDQRIICAPLPALGPRHISTPYMEERKRAAGAAGGLGSPRAAGPATPRGEAAPGGGSGAGSKGDALKLKYPEFFELYGYD